MFGKTPAQTESTPTSPDGKAMTTYRNGKAGATVAPDRDFRAMVERMEANQQTIIKLLTEIRDARS